MIKRILILRPDNLGDFVLFSGALRLIREAHPRARIVLCVKQYVQNAAELCPYVDEVWDWNALASPFGALEDRKSKRIRMWLEWRFRWILNWRHLFDVVLVPMRSPKAGYWGTHQILNELRAKQKLGIKGDFANQTVDDDAVASSGYTGRLSWPPGQWPQHEFDLTRQFLDFAGINSAGADLWPEFWTNAMDKKWAQAKVARQNKWPILAVCPGVTSCTKKFYSGARIADAISILSRRTFNIAIFGSPAERGMCGEVADAVSRCRNVRSVANLAGQSTVRQTIECLRLCDYVITQETASAHIAAALRKPMVVIIGGGHFGRFFPWGNAAIQRPVKIDMECYGCNWKCKYGDLRCIQDISPQMVAAELDRAIAANEDMTEAREAESQTVELGT